MCTHAGCPNPTSQYSLLGSLKWGLSDAVCGDHFKHTQGLITKRCATVDKGYLEDFARLYILMSDRTQVMKYLKALDDDIAAAQKSPPASAAPLNWLRLSDALRAYETKCWFPPDILLPLGVLTAADFFFYIRRGYVLKDYGAGVRHGEFTHRLQWHAVARAVTGNFLTANPKDRGWDHTPLDLYSSLGRPAHTAATLWAYLFDRNGEGDFHYPDTLHAAVLGDTSLAALGAMVRGRETKRRNQLVELIGWFLQEKNPADDIPAFLKGNFDLTTHAGFKEFEKWFLFEHMPAKTNWDLADTSPGGGREKLTNFYNKLKQQGKGGSNEYEKAKTDASFKSKHGSKYTPSSGPGGVYQTSTNAIMTEAEADVRVKASYTGFNKDALL